MEEQNRGQLNSSILESSWREIERVRQPLALELDSMAADLPGDGGRQLRSLSEWFRGTAKIETALERPDVLAVCLPLVEVAADGPISNSDIAHAARVGFCSVGQTSSLMRQLFKLLLYPFLILLAAVVLGLGFCFWVAHPFEEIYDEFGIGLPLLTEIILDGASFVRRWWWCLLAFAMGIAIGALLLDWIANRPGRNGRPANLSWLDQQWMSSRQTLAIWAWHLSLLLEAGINQGEAARIAGMATGKPWFRQACRATAKSRSVESEHQPPFMFHSKFELLNSAIRLPTSAGKIALLRNTANYYRDRNRITGDWWIHWVVSLMLWGIGITVFICVLALFFPLLSVVAGLTGGRW